MHVNGILRFIVKQMHWTCYQTEATTLLTT